MTGFLKEAKRRNVHRVALGYVAVGWLFTEVLSTALPAFDAPDWITKTVLVVYLLGLPLALWLSWEFEITTDGIRRTHEVTPGTSIVDVTGRKLDFAIIGALVVALAFVVMDAYVLDDGAEPVAEFTEISQVDSIAVLPFSDFSAGGDQAHLAVGLSDSILHMLAQVDGLKVAARTSSFSFGQDVTVREVGEELGVATVLEGSVQRSGDTLRIIAQLVRSSDQSHLWSETFDRPAGDIFAIQDEIAAAVVEVLRPQASGTVGVSVNSEAANIEAFEYFARGNQLWQRRTLSDIEAAIEAFREAIRIDPDYAQAHSGLAMAYIFSTYYGSRTTDEIELIAMQAIERALQLDPGNALAYAARAQLLDDRDRVPEAIADFRRAIELNPNDPYPYIWLANNLGDTHEDILEGMALKRRAFELDPRNTFVIGHYAAMILQFENDLEGALALYRRSITLDPEDPRAYNNIANLYSGIGRIDDSIRARLAQIERSPGSPNPYSALAQLFLNLDDQEAAERWFALARERNPNLEYWNYWFLDPEHHDRLVANAERLFADEGSMFRQQQLVEAYVVAGRDEDALRLALQLIEGEDGQLDLSLNQMGPIQIAIWLLPETDPRRTEMLGWMDALIERYAAEGFEGSGIYGGRAYRALAGGDREGAIANVREAIARGDRLIRVYRNYPWFRQLQGDPAFDAAIAELEAIIARQRSSLRVEGI